MKVANMDGISNQFIISDNRGVWFQSYESIIAIKPYSGKTQLDARYWDYSSTTGKYRNQFLGETKAETQRKIDNGEYILTDLNGGI